MNEFIELRDARALTAEDIAQRRPIQAVWEITLACDLKCHHCGSRAGKARPRELSTEECLDLIDQLAAMGCREVNLIGGEAYLRRDWLELIRAIRAHGMVCAIQTGARNLTPRRIDRAVEAGLQSVGVSIDGLAEVHDRQRGVPGSFDKAMQALRELRRRGIPTQVNTQLNRLSVPDLRGLLGLLRDAGVNAWRFQLTVAMGRAADQHDWLLQPFEIPDVLDLCAELAEEGNAHGVSVLGGNNIGYYGPHHEQLRALAPRLQGQLMGCGAGRFTLGVEADGAIKGCPSLPTGPYTGGNIRDLSLEQIWEHTDALSVRRHVRREDLWGFCRTCYYADVCQAGCTWTSHVLFGRPGNNPYCSYRARRLAEQGIRERVEPVQAAPGLPFDHGTFALRCEDLDGNPLALAPEEIEDPYGPAWPGGLRDLRKCMGCGQYVWDQEADCVFCGVDMDEAERSHVAYLKEVLTAQQPLLANLAQLLQALEEDDEAW